MPAKSKKQRIAMAIAEHEPNKLYARNRGMLDMSHQQLNDFAATPQKSLPESVPNSSPATPARGEPVPGLMATRQNLRGIRNDSIRHIKKSSRG